ncbi:serine/threonine-protein kinase [Aeromonas caviae]|uniref:serine/threonine-protein kinase n=1 Tax=Aeromonas caviae TaxID=648 RepID=UPI002B471463|nr:serine/threonine-protein kinase [Aeromonas caviae]
MEEFHSYRIKKIKRLGEGAFGYVDEVELYNSGNKLCGVYARKTLSPQEDILNEISWEEIRRRFTREVIYQSQCPHRNIVYIYLFNKHAEKPYFIMDLGSSDLNSEIHSGTLSQPDRVSIFKSVLMATKKIHDKNFLHRDIKPQNIIKFPDGSYKLSDFGLVKNVDANDKSTVLTLIGGIMGTTRYMAPEILIDAEYSQQTDIYALGMVFNDLGIRDTKLQKIATKCTRRDKDSRYTTIDEILHDIGEYSLTEAIGVEIRS